MIFNFFDWLYGIRSKFFTEVGNERERNYSAGYAVSPKPGLFLIQVCYQLGIRIEGDHFKEIIVFRKEIY